ncbi:MAG: DUF4142 domain-containing protein [Pseudomonadota bacterium]|nr:DUF4142 domain-containing protein [Pseudomonadota bacterium]
MKKYMLALAALSIAITAGCRNDETGDETAMASTDTAITAPSNDHATPTDQAAYRGTDADASGMTQDSTGAGTRAGDPLARGLLAAIDEHEIAAGEQAQAKGVTGEVLDYAKLMVQAHGDNLAKTRSLGSLSDGAAVQAMKEKGASERQSLDKASGDAYEKAYIDAMVKGHQDALDKIDNEMMPAAASDAVRQHLANSREHVATHLAKAREIAASQ